MEAGFDRTVSDAAPSSRRAGGLLLLGLIFLASAVSTLVYLSNTRGYPEVSQAAAAAADPFIGLSLEARGAYVVDLKTEEVLYSSNADVQLPLASLTKIPLVLVVSEVLAPDSLIEVPVHTPPDGAIKRIPDGSTWRVQDLVDFTLVSSSNEGAEILAEAAEPRMEKRYPQATPGAAILWRMNVLVKDLGMTHMYFLNVSGLDISTTQGGAYGSARDVAALFAYAASSTPSTFEGTARRGLLRTSLEGDRATAKNTDKALSAIPGLILGKTGTTDLAGGNLAVVFDIGPARPIVAVVLGSSDAGRFDDIKKLVAATQASIAGGR